MEPCSWWIYFLEFLKHFQEFWSEVGQKYFFETVKDHKCEMEDSGAADS